MDDGPYAPFCDPVLMVSSNATVSDCLLLQSKIVEERLRGKRMIITAKRLELDIKLRGIGLELSLALEGLSSSERDLVFNENLGGVRINIDGTSMISFRLGLLPTSVR